MDEPGVVNLRPEVLWTNSVGNGGEIDRTVEPRKNTTTTGGNTHTSEQASESERVRHTHTHTHTRHTHTHTHTHTQQTHTRTHMHKHAPIRPPSPALTHTRAHADTRAHVYMLCHSTVLEKFTWLIENQAVT